MAQVGHADRQRKKETEEDGTNWLSLAMEMAEESKARLEKMVATTQLRLTLKTDEERRANKKIVDFLRDYQ